MNTQRGKHFSSLSLVLGLSMGLMVGNIPAGAQQNRTQQNRGKQAAAETDNEAVLAIYADAANFQNNGEPELAIDQWQKLLKDFPKDPLAPKAAHYLGVCYMQLPQPKYDLASNAFAAALKTEKYDLREESLANLGWCNYALGSDINKRDPQRLNQALESYAKLLKEFPGSRFADRALFYTGEANYHLGQAEAAIASYDRLLTSKLGETSSLRCDALYAKGVAQEDLKQYDAAVDTYRKMLSSCGDDPLATPVRLQLAEVLVLQGKYRDAEPMFAQVMETKGDDRPRAMARRAFALTQMNRGEEAAKLYDALIQEFPQSPFAASALMASAQSLYRAAKYDEAAARFQQVVDSQTDKSAATEAAHWLSVIAMRSGQVEQAEKVARVQIQKGLDGPYAMMVRVDAAEALSMQNGKQADALQEFETLVRDAAGDKSLMPRILYNAAFTAYQLGQSEKAIALAKQFEQQFAEDPLVADVRYISAEAYLQAGDAENAINAYDSLLKTVPQDHPQKSLWTLRAATAMLNGGRYQQTIDRLSEALPSLNNPNQQAEAYFLIGSANMGAEQPQQAMEAFGKGLQVNPQWPRSDQMLFRLGVAQAAAGDQGAAEKTWQKVIADFAASPLAGQARYRLAQAAADAGDLQNALTLYDQLLNDQANPQLRPFALYGKGWGLLQAERYEEAIAPLTEFVEGFENHPLRDDSLLARGISHSRLGKTDLATTDLNQFLAMMPEGTNLGHGLYELALVERKANRPRQARDYLQRVVNEVVDYPAMNNVLYELAWSNKEANDQAAAAKFFSQLAERYPDSAQAAEASYYLGQYFYEQQDWSKAEVAYRRAAERSNEAALQEKALYRLGWSGFQQKKYDEAAAAFRDQATKVPDGELSIDALMMIGECRFAAGNYEQALPAYVEARNVIERRDGDDRKFTDKAEQQVRELVYLHGGQSAGQLKRWEEALQWYDALRKRYPSSNYLPQVFYETGFAYQQMGKTNEAVKFFQETANTFRDESAARARFMLGEIYFQRNQPAEAITEYKRVMYGFGAEKAPEAIKDWQAKSGFEAGRCAELLIQANQGERRRQAIEVAQRYYQYVTENHSEHELANKARERLEALKRL